MKFSFLFAAILLLSTVLFAQQDSTDPRRIKPTEQLERLKRYIGEFSLIMDQSNRKLTGMIKTEFVVKGWYIERTITSKTDDGTIDSEIRCLITWDPNINRYRIWRFVPLSPIAKHDGVGWFDGDTFIEEYEFDPSDTKRKLLRNRITMTNADEIKIVNEIEDNTGKISIRGIITAKRLK